jgi:adenylosuccinate synthase
MSGVQLNGNGAVPQPQTLLEEIIQIQSENVSISGGLQRNRITQKKQATLSYDMLAPSDYRTLLTIFTTGSGIGYYNDLSAYTNGIFTFSGLPYFTEAEYVPGASLYKPFQVRIREQ